MQFVKTYSTPFLYKYQYERISYMYVSVNCCRKQAKTENCIDVVTKHTAADTRELTLKVTKGKDVQNAISILKMTMDFGCFLQIICLEEKFLFFCFLGISTLLVSYYFYMYNPGQNSWDIKAITCKDDTFLPFSPHPDAMLMSGIQVIFGRLNIAWGQGEGGQKKWLTKIILPTSI